MSAEGGEGGHRGLEGEVSHTIESVVGLLNGTRKGAWLYLEVEEGGEGLEKEEETPRMRDDQARTRRREAICCVGRSGRVL